MIDTSVSTAAIAGYRRSRRNIFGRQARLVRVEDGVLQVLDTTGKIDEQVALAETRVALRRGLVEVDTGERHFFLFGLGAANHVPPELVELAARQPADRAIEAPHGGPLAAAQTSRTLHELLLAHGASADAVQ